jgi:hypothetical protein
MEHEKHEYSDVVVGPPQFTLSSTLPRAGLLDT